MYLYLSNNEKLELLKPQDLEISKKNLLFYLGIVKKNTLKLIKKLASINNIISIENDKCINPIEWQLGHISHFYIIHTLNLLNTKNGLHIDILKSYIKQIEKQFSINFSEDFGIFPIKTSTASCTSIPPTTDSIDG